MMGASEHTIRAPQQSNAYRRWAAHYTRGTRKRTRIHFIFYHMISRGTASIINFITSILAMYKYSRDFCKQHRIRSPASPPSCLPVSERVRVDCWLDLVRLSNE